VIALDAAQLASYSQCRSHPFSYLLTKQGSNSFRDKENIVTSQCKKRLAPLNSHPQASNVYVPTTFLLNESYGSI